MPQLNPTLLDLMRSDFAEMLAAADDTQRDARMVVIDHFIAFANRQLGQIGFSQLRFSAGGYVGQLTDGRNFAIVPEETTPENSTGEMEPSSYAQIGGGELPAEAQQYRMNEEQQRQQGIGTIS